MRHCKICKGKGTDSTGLYHCRCRKKGVATIRLFSLLTTLLFSTVCSAGVPFTDAEILGISLTTQNIQVRARDAVCPRVFYWDLKNLCNVLVNDNVGYINALQGFIQQSGIQPAASERSKQIQKEGEEALAVLIRLEGTKLDRAYLGYELKLHRDTLTTIRDEFLPSVQSPQLGKMISDIQPVMQNRLEWAVRIDGAIPSGWRRK